MAYFVKRRENIGETLGHRRGTPNSEDGTRTEPPTERKGASADSSLPLTSAKAPVPMFLKLLATVSREGQIGPQVVHVARRGSGTRVIALSAKHPDIMISVWLPYGCPAAPAGQVVHKRYAVGKIRAVFVDVAGALPPNPDRKSTRLNSSHQIISYAVFC